MATIEALVKFAAKLDAGKAEVAKDDIRKVARKLSQAFTEDRAQVLQIKSKTLASLLSLVPEVKDQPLFAMGLAAPELAVEPLNERVEALGLPKLKVDEVERLLYAVNDLSEGSLASLRKAATLFE